MISELDLDNFENEILDSNKQFSPAKKPKTPRYLLRKTTLAKKDGAFLDMVEGGKKND